jgi:hypothetical protein
MTNVFDSASYPETEPDVLVQGDRWTWKRTDLTEYPPASYTLTYEVVEERAGTRRSFTLTAAGSGSDHVIEVGAADTAVHTAGTYRWAAYITRDSDSERARIGTGTWRVAPDLATDQSDHRTFAQQQIERLEATLAALSARQESNYSIAGRSAVLRELTETRKELNHWKWVRSGEIATERAKRGLPSPNVIKSRFKA